MLLSTEWEVIQNINICRGLTGLNSGYSTILVILFFFLPRKRQTQWKLKRLDLYQHLESKHRLESIIFFSVYSLVLKVFITECSERFAETCSCFGEKNSLSKFSCKYNTVLESIRRCQILKFRTAQIKSKYWHFQQLTSKGRFKSRQLVQHNISQKALLQYCYNYTVFFLFEFVFTHYSVYSQL